MNFRATIRDEFPGRRPGGRAISQHSRLAALAEKLIEKALSEIRRVESNSDRRATAMKLRDQRWAAYQKLVVFYLYVKHLPYFDELVIAEPITGKPVQRKAAWRTFRRDFEELLHVAELPLPAHLTAAHTFAVFSFGQASIP